MQRHILMVAVTAAFINTSCGETSFKGTEAAKRAKSSDTVETALSRGGVAGKNLGDEETTPGLISTKDESSTGSVKDGVSTGDASTGTSDDSSSTNTGNNGASTGNNGASTGNNGASTGDDGANTGGSSTATPGTDSPPIRRDDSAIAHCLEAWTGQHPFGKNPKYRTINVSAFLGTLSLVWDQRSTKDPELVYIRSDFSSPIPIGASGYQLQNPNGWYCLDVNFDKNERWPKNGVGNIAGLPVPSFGDVGTIDVMVTCRAHLAQVHHTGATLASFASVLRMNLFPPVPCLDGKDHLLKLDWKLPMGEMSGSIF